jgi:hypothetical protein
MKELNKYIKENSAEHGPLSVVDNYEDEERPGGLSADESAESVPVFIMFIPC